MTRASTESAETLPATSRERDADPDLAVVDPTRYTERVEIAQGGMGRVVAARDQRLRRKVAIKELRADSPELRIRFEREALLTARLQHPSIVSIHEAGRWPSGEPFYAMKLIAGRSLDRVVAAATSLDERLALLPHALAVADALAYAHQEHIVHRDLKPQNVLVGDFGETVVIDWGLAKDLAAGPDAAVSLPRVAEDGGSVTVAGDVLGTPAYMPPEQAQGQAVDERADVYAIGALVYHLLAGVPPYQGGSGVEVLQALIDRAPRRLAELQPGVSSDLLAIVERAMARDPRDRYPSARELAADLRRFQSGQLVGAHRYSRAQLLRRWLRRHRTAAIVGAISLAAVATIGVVSVRRILHEQRRVEAERRVAVESRADAEELMEFMLGDLSDRLAPMNRLELLDTVARKARDYYARRPDARGPSDQRRRAAALQRVGAVLSSEGDVEAALAVFRDALATQDALASANGDDDPALAYERAAIHRTIAHLLIAQGDAPGGMAELRVAIAIAESEPGADRDDSRRLALVCRHDVADVLGLQGDTGAALAGHREALSGIEALAAKSPDSAELQQDLAASHMRIGDELRAQGDSSAALRAFLSTRALLERLVARDPGNALMERELAISQLKVSDLRVAQGDDAAAIADLRLAESTLARLAAADPRNADLQRDLSVCHSKLGSVLERQGDLAGALIAYRADLEIAARLAARDPDNVSMQRDLSVSHDSLGDALRAAGDLAAARVEYEASRAIATTLAAKDPSQVEWQRDLAISHDNVGDVLIAQGETDAAGAAFRASFEISTRLALADPSNTELQRDLTFGHLKLGDVARARGDAAAARAAYDLALANAETLTTRDPANAEWAEDAAEVREQLRTCCALRR